MSRTVPGAEGLERRLRAAAFGAEPGAWSAVPRDAAPKARWLAAAALGGQGRYAAAAVLLDDLVADPGTPRAVAAHAAVTRAAHLRQLGGHARAQVDDGLGLRWATTAVRHEPDEPDDDGTDAAAARVDALVGLAADAVGLGRPLVASRLLDSAESSCRDHPSWRLRVRIGWVRAETALLEGRAAAAVEPAEQAVATAEAAGATRHLVKSRVIRVVASAAAGAVAPDDAVAALDGLAEECSRLGLMPLEWPCRLAAADLVSLLGQPANESATHMAQRSPSDTPSGSTRRRHAALVTMNDVVRRSHPIGRRLMGVSARSVAFLAVM